MKISLPLSLALATLTLAACERTVVAPAPAPALSPQLARRRSDGCVSRKPGRHRSGGATPRGAGLDRAGDAARIRLDRTRCELQRLMPGAIRMSTESLHGKQRVGFVRDAA